MPGSRISPQKSARQRTFNYTHVAFHVEAHVLEYFFCLLESNFCERKVWLFLLVILYHHVEPIYFLAFIRDEKEETC
jgi:hypothetical protein